LTSYNGYAGALLLPSTFFALAMPPTPSFRAQRPDTVVAEARVLAWQLEAGIERSKLLVEDRARNTRENALFSKE
jgi:uncharacterized SAM-binding protein YcdF (DUF218 family)